MEWEWGEGRDEHTDCIRMEWKAIHRNWGEGPVSR
jgi:hypothetical protein